MNLSNNWIAGPGQFWILFISWGSVALFYTVMAIKLGKAIHSESDGCLLAICNLLFVPVGGMLGLLFFRFPYNLLCSMFLALLFPSLLTQMWIRRTDPRRKR